MKRTKRARKIVTQTIALLVTFSLVALSGCAGATGSRDADLKPSVASPVIGENGVLRVGVDSTNNPYAGTLEGEIVGIDVEIAAALAEELGLKLQLVDTSAQGGDALLSEGAVDVVMNIEPMSDDGMVFSGTLIGPYLETGPALFTVVKSETTTPQVDLASLAGTTITAQQNSLSATALEEVIGAGTADVRESLADAFTALENGEVSYAASDAVVGSYIVLDMGYENIACVKMLGTPISIYMGVSAENAELATALTTAMNTLRENGVLKTIVSKWLGPISASIIVGAGTTSSQSADGSSSPAVPDGTLDTGEGLPDPSNASSAP